MPKTQIYVTVSLLKFDVKIHNQPYLFDLISNADALTWWRWRRLTSKTFSLLRASLCSSYIFGVYACPSRSRLMFFWRVTFQTRYRNRKPENILYSLRRNFTSPHFFLRSPLAQIRKAVHRYQITFLVSLDHKLPTENNIYIQQFSLHRL